MSAPPAPPDAAHAAEATARVTPMMEQYLEIKAANPGLLLFYRMGDFYELFFEDAEIASQALGIVLTKRGKHQGADIPMCGVPVERSEDYLHRLIAPAIASRCASRPKIPAAAQGARQQERGAPRRGAPGHAGHADRRHAARCPRQQLSAGDRARPRLGRRRPLRARLDRHLDLRIHRHGMRGGELAATLARINPNEVIVTDALYSDDELGAAAARIAGGDAADPRRVRRRHRRAAAVRLFCGRHHGRPRRAVAAGGDRRRRRRHLYRPHAGRQAPAAVAAGARSRRHHHGDRSGDPRQSRTDAHACRRTARLAARRHRLHGDRRPARGCWRSGWPRR